jgi:hypothetical protein
MIIDSKWRPAKTLIRCIGNCPHCNNTAPQTLQYTYLLEIGDENQEINPERAYFMFACDTCNELLLYQAEFPNKDLEYREKFDEEEFFQPFVVEYYDLFELVWPRFEKQEYKLILDASVPKSVRECYELGGRVRPLSQDLYALQLRKVLEAICKSLGADEFLPQSGKRAMLWQQIDHLRNNHILSPRISSAAHELKTLGNVGAHYSELPVSTEHIRKLEALIQLIVTYVYEKADNSSRGDGTIQVEDNIH